MGSACFYSFQTVLLSSAASFISELLESSREMKAGAGVLALRCLAEQLYFPCCSPRRHARKMIQPFPLLTLQNNSTTSLLLGASAPGPPLSNCKMERMAATH